MKVTIQKGLAMNEVITFEVSMGQDIAGDWDRKVVPALACLDKRYYDLNMRVHEANEMTRKSSLDVRNRVTSIFAQLHGQPFNEVRPDEPAADVVAADPAPVANAMEAV